MIYSQPIIYARMILLFSSFRHMHLGMDAGEEKEAKKWRNKFQ